MARPIAAEGSRKRRAGWPVAPGSRALAPTPHDAVIQLNTSEAGSLFAVWSLNREVGLEEAGNACSLMAPTRIFIMIDPAENVLLPLDPTLTLTMEAFGAGRD